VASTITTGFDPTQHQLDGNGWVNSYPDASGAIISTHFPTLTAAQNAAQDIFSDDPTIHAVLTNEASAQYLATNAGSVNTIITGLRTGEGLDGPYP
jgi:hypothetical protein